MLRLTSLTPSVRPRTSAINSQVTPHSGYHWDGTNRRFFEGWYFKVMMPKEKESFALIFSVEDPGGRSPISGIGAQVMGPGDGYLVQYDLDVSKFWAGKESLTLGSCFEMKKGKPQVRRMISKEAFDDTVLTGFQSSYDFHQGRIIQKESGTKGHIDPTVERCSWSFNVKSQTGWGDLNQSQKATSGWLAVLPVFEPHWQVMMARGSASGWMEWGDRRFEFEDAPTYYEKNWGAGFPSKWFWIQCNTFDQESDLSVTVVGARRKIPGPQPIEETVGMIGIHHLGKFYEFVPWEGQVSWKVEPWGFWSSFASAKDYEAEVTAICDSKGTILRAPLDEEGLTPFCRDSFFAKTTLKLWKTSKSRKELIVEASSDTGVVEVGGGPWWNTWNDKANMQEPLKSLVKLPIDVKEISKFVPPPLRPPGL